MLRKPKLLPLFSLLAATAAMAQQTAPVQQPVAPEATAQQAGSAQPAPTRQQLQEPPRQAESIERKPEPPLIPPKQPTTRIVEKKTGNVVTEATVTSGGSTYVLRPKTGTAETGEVAGGPSRAPLWSVLQFGKPKPKEGEQAAEGEQQAKNGTPAKRAEVPPPPPMTPPSK